jgi:hypothetical protein
VITADGERPRLPRCPYPACPVRYRRGGEDRVCADHADDTGAAAFDRRKDAWSAVAAAGKPRA